MTRSRTAELICLALIVGAALLLRGARAGWDSLSLDESWHLALSTGRGSPQLTLPRAVLLERVPSVTGLEGAAPAWGLWGRMARVVHPPLYVIALRCWREVLGGGDGAAQWLSVLCSVGAVVLLWHAARTAFGPATGLWAAAMLAAAPTQLFMAQEVRGYALLLLLGCWALSAAARIERDGVTPARANEVAAAVLLMMLTHYFAIGAAIAIGAWAVIRFRDRGRWTVLLGLAGAGLVFAAAWGPFAVRQLAEASAATETWLTDPAADAARLALARAAALPVRLIVEADFGAAAWPALIGAIVFVAPAFLLRRRPALWLFWLWLLGTGGLLLVLDLARGTRHLSFIRYALLASPGVAVLLAAGSAAVRPIAMHAVGAAVTAVSLWLMPTAFTPEAPDYRALPAEVHHLLGKDDVLVFYAGASSELHMEALFLAASREPRWWPRDAVLLTRPADAALTARLAGRRVVILSGPLGPAGAAGAVPRATDIARVEIVDRFDRRFAEVTIAQVTAP